MKEYKWATLGCGVIANQLAQAFAANGRKLYSVANRTHEKAVAFAEKYADILAIGYDFSPGMLHKAKAKDVAGKVTLVNGDAACLSFVDDCFDVVCCSHALYELKGEMRTAALQEMKRVVKPQGQVLIMEHEVPQKPLVKMMFYLRMMMMGPTDSNEFVKQGLSPFTKIFSDVTLSHTPSGKSKLIICRKNILQNSKGKRFFKKYKSTNAKQVACCIRKLQNY